MEKRSVKVYVPVLASFDENGCLIPTEVIWEDGTKYEIDSVLDVRPAPALKVGGQGDRYTVLIHGQSSHLFFERSASLSGNQMGRWFVERK